MYNKVVGSPPKTIAEVVRIPFELTITKEGHPFLLGFQSFYGCDGSLVGPIIIFATKKDLIHLFQQKLICADGTFNIKPRPYHNHKGAQVFTLNTLDGVFPNVRLYRRLTAILPSKSEVCIIIDFIIFLIIYIRIHTFNSYHILCRPVIYNSCN